MKIVIEIRRDANVNVILNNLYRFTQMQTTYSVNMIALDHGQPKCLNLKQILEAYLPAKLTEEEIKEIINSLEDKSMPNIMKHFKLNYLGKCDMKLVNKLANEYK